MLLYLDGTRGIKTLTGMSDGLWFPKLLKARRLAL